MRATSTHWIGSAALAAACGLVESPAFAHGYGLGAELWIDATGTYMPNGGVSSPLGVSQDSNSARPNITGTTSPFGFATGFVGARMGFDWVVSDRWIVPILDAGFYGIVGVYSDVLTSADGTFFKIHPAGTFMMDMDILGFGVRFKRRRWMFEGTIKPGVAMLAVPAAVADGKAWTSVDQLNSASPTLRASLSVCRRLDPMERVCLSLTPNIYQWGWGNGGSIALRWELGT